MFTFISKLFKRIFGHSNEEPKLSSIIILVTDLMTSDSKFWIDDVKKSKFGYDEELTNALKSHIECETIKDILALTNTPLVDDYLSKLDGCVVIVDNSETITSLEWNGVPIIHQYKSLHSVEFPNDILGRVKWVSDQIHKSKLIESTETVSEVEVDDTSNHIETLEQSTSDDGFAYILLSYKGMDTPSILKLRQTSKKATLSEHVLTIEKLRYLGIEGFYIFSDNLTSLTSFISELNLVPAYTVIIFDSEGRLHDVLSSSKVRAQKVRNYFQDVTEEDDHICRILKCFETMS